MSKSIRGAIASFLFKTFGVGAGCLGILLLMALGPLFGGWALMLGLGVVHHEISAEVPAVGYWPCVLLFWVLAVLASVFKRGAK